MNIQEANIKVGETVTLEFGLHDFRQFVITKIINNNKLQIKRNEGTNFDGQGMVIETLIYDESTDKWLLLANVKSKIQVKLISTSLDNNCDNNAAENLEYCYRVDPDEQADRTNKLVSSLVTE